MKWALHLGTVLAGWMELSLAMNAPHGKNKTHVTSGAKELYSYIIIIICMMTLLLDRYAIHELWYHVHMHSKQEYI